LAFVDMYMYWIILGRNALREYLKNFQMILLNIINILKFLAQHLIGQISLASYWSWHYDFASH